MNSIHQKATRHPVNGKTLLVATMMTISLSSCTGTTGTIRARTWKGEGTDITEIRSLGIQIRNIQGYHGISLGEHRTIYATRSEGAHPSDPEDATWAYGHCDPPPEMPIYLQEYIFGTEAALSPTFMGLTAGITTRSTAMLPLNRDENMIIHLNEKNPPSITHHTQLTP